MEKRKLRLKKAEADQKSNIQRPRKDHTHEIKTASMHRGLLQNLLVCYGMAGSVPLVPVEVRFAHLRRGSQYHNTQTMVAHAAAQCS